MITANEVVRLLPFFVLLPGVLIGTILVGVWTAHQDPPPRVERRPGPCDCGRPDCTDSVR